jgi:type III restriction enzyme
LKYSARATFSTYFGISSKLKAWASPALKTDPPAPVIISPIQERLAYDIAIPITKPSLEHDIRKLSELKVDALDAIYEQEDLAEQFRVKLKLEFATTETEVHEADIAAGELPPAHELLASITNKVIDRAKLPNRFAELYPRVRDYVASRCFGKSVELEDDALRSHLSRLDLQEGVAKYLARKIAELTIERRAIEFDNADFRLSETKLFSWRRNLPPLEAAKTVFNYVATYNDFERRFAVFLDKKAGDVVRFASLGTTEQGDSGTQFRVDYLKPSGAIGFYHPDWVAVQKTKAGEVNWIIETKGRVWEGTTAKDDALNTWCERVSAVTGAVWRFKRINQVDFDGLKLANLAELLDA